MTKRYAFIGDIHSQSEPFSAAIAHCAKNGLTPILLGDLFDSRVAKSDSVGVYRKAQEAQRDLGAIILRSNHQNKFERYARRGRVPEAGDLLRTFQDFSERGIDLQEVLSWLDEFPYGVVIRDSRGTEYRCAHAKFPSWIHVPVFYEDIYVVSEVSGKSRESMLYGPRQSDGSRAFWWENDSDRDWVRVAGHYHNVHIDSKSLVLDGGMGGTLFDSHPSEKGFLCLWDVESQNLLKFE